MSYWILTSKGRIISCSTVQRLTYTEAHTDEYTRLRKLFDDDIRKKFDAENVELGTKDAQLLWNRLTIGDIESDEAFVEEFRRVISDNKLPDADDTYSQMNDPQYINMELGLPRGPDDELLRAKVKRRAVDLDGNPVGRAHDNPLLDTRHYIVEYIDGSEETLSANIIAENLLAQVNEEGHRQLLLDEIIDHRTNDQAVTVENGFTETPSGARRRKLTTKGWEICVQWKDGQTTWIALKDLKESYPVELAEYAINNKIQNEPAFAWWVPYVVKKKERIISRIKSRYWERTHTYGIRMPKSAKEAYEIDKQNNETFWTNAITEEMKKVRVAFAEYDGDVAQLVGYEELGLHLVFDIKMSEGFRRKARLVADGHKTDPPSSVTYSTVVSRDSIRIILMIAALNDLEVMSGDIENAYLNAPCREKYWTKAGPEFGDDCGKVFVVVRAIYGLKSSGAAYRAFLAKVLDEIGFTLSMGDPDVWYRAASKPDGEKYYEYMLVYVDDLLCVSHNAKNTMSELKRLMKFKKDKIAPPEMYLGATLEHKMLNGRKVWTMTSKDYIKAAIKNVEKNLQENFSIKLPARAPTPLPQNYVPENDMSEELNAKEIGTYQEMIGILRWAIEIGRVDIYLEVSLISAYQAAPRRGHLERLAHIFSFLKKNPKLTLYFGPALPRIDPNTFVGNTSEDFKEFYRDTKEEIPERIPKPLGRAITITAFVDASHAANKVNRRSHTGYIIFINRAPIIWFSKRQNTVETSTFSSEFIAMKTCVEHISALRYKLRMFGIPIDGPAGVLCDNQSCVNGSSMVDSTLSKKHVSLAYHATRRHVAVGTITVGKIDPNENLADALTKMLTIAKREYLFGNWTY